MKRLMTYRLLHDVEADEKAAAECMVANTEPTLTQQQFAEDADINVLARRFGLDKVAIPAAPLDPSFYGDFTEVPDLRTAMDLVNEATNRFMDLPAKLRERFDNNPAKLWHFVNDPENGPEAVRLGLLKQVQEPQEVTDSPPKEGGEQGT